MSNILTNNINPRSGNKITIGGVNDTVSIAGTVTYEDVTSVDSIGVVTARGGLDVGIGGTFFHVGTTTSYLYDNTDNGGGGKLCIGGTQNLSDGDFGSGIDIASIEFYDSNVKRTNWIGLGSDRDNLCISADHYSEGGDSAIEFKIDGVTILKLADGENEDSYFSGGSNTSFFNFNCSGQNVEFNADDNATGRQYISFNYNCTDSNDFSTGTDWATLGIVDNSGTLDLVRTTQSGNDVFLLVQGKTGTSNNIITRFRGDADSLDIDNNSPGDYLINNPGQDNRIRFADGTGGIDIIYAGDTTKHFRLDSTGVVSRYIHDTTSTSSSNLLRIASVGYTIQRSTSSRRYKNNISTYTGIGLSRIEQITPKVWEDFNTGEKIVGIIAEELHEIGFTDAVSYSPWNAGSELGYGDEPSPMIGNGSTPITKNNESLDDEVEVVDGISDRVLMCEMLIAIKQLKAENESLKQRISALESN